MASPVPNNLCDSCFYSANHLRHLFDTWWHRTSPDFITSGLPSLCLRFNLIKSFKIVPLGKTHYLSVHFSHIQGEKQRPMLWVYSHAQIFHSLVPQSANYKEMTGKINTLTSLFSSPFSHCGLHCLNPTRSSKDGLEEFRIPNSQEASNLPNRNCASWFLAVLSRTLKFMESRVTGTKDKNNTSGLRGTIVREREQSHLYPIVPRHILTI